NYPGDATHSASSDTETFAIAKAASVVTLACADAEFSGSPQETCSATVTGDGGLNQSLTVDYINNVDAGTASASATYPGDANYNTSSAAASFQIRPKNLHATASTESSINIAKNGNIVFTLSNVSGILAGDGTVYDLFNGATFRLRIGGENGTLYSVSSTA